MLLAFFFIASRDLFEKSGCTGPFEFSRLCILTVPTRNGSFLDTAIGQSAPMVAALWGVFVWHEFRGAGTPARVNLVLMFVFFIAAIALVSLAYSAGG